MTEVVMEVVMEVVGVVKVGPKGQRRRRRARWGRWRQGWAGHKKAPGAGRTSMMPERAGSSSPQSAYICSATCCCDMAYSMVAYVASRCRREEGW